MLSASRSVVVMVLRRVGCLTEPGIICWIVAPCPVRAFRTARDDSTLRGRRRSSGGHQGHGDNGPLTAIGCPQKKCHLLIQGDDIFLHNSAYIFQKIRYTIQSAEYSTFSPTLTHSSNPPSKIYMSENLSFSRALNARGLCLPFWQ